MTSAEHYAARNPATPTAHPSRDASGTLSVLAKVLLALLAILAATYCVVPFEAQLAGDLSPGVARASQ